MKNKMMVYHLLGAAVAGGMVEKVWGQEMLTKHIDASDKTAVDEAKRDGWVKSPAEVIEQIETQKMQVENSTMKKQIAFAQSGANFDMLTAKNGALKQQVDDLRQQVVQLTEQLNNQSSNASASTAKKPTDKVKSDPKADVTPT